jgi:hypothetical protein
MLEGPIGRRNHDTTSDISPVHRGFSRGTSATAERRSRGSGSDASAGPVLVARSAAQETGQDAGDLQIASRDCGAGPLGAKGANKKDLHAESQAINIEVFATTWSFAAAMLFYLIARTAISIHRQRERHRYVPHRLEQVKAEHRRAFTQRED